MQNQITKQNQQIQKYKQEKDELQNIFEKQRNIINEMIERIEKNEAEKNPHQ